MKKYVYVLAIFIVLCSTLSFAEFKSDLDESLYYIASKKAAAYCMKEKITIPKENYDNLKILIKQLGESKTMCIEHVRNIQSGMQKQIDEIWVYCRPMTGAEEISLLKGEISILKMRLNILEGKKK